MSNQYSNLNQKKTRNHKHKKENREKSLFFPNPTPDPRPRGEAPPSASGAPITTKTTTYTPIKTSLISQIVTHFWIPLYHICIEYRIIRNIMYTERRMPRPTLYPILNCLHCIAWLHPIKKKVKLICVKRRNVSSE
jgi:hypothetical protein